MLGDDENDDDEATFGESWPVHADDCVWAFAEYGLTRRRSGTKTMTVALQTSGVQQTQRHITHAPPLPGALSV
jgi:hypothetical protein